MTSSNHNRLKMTSSSLLTFIIVLFNTVVWTTAMRLTNMTGPLVQDLREDMVLNCQFDMGAEELYSVKWYKDDHEFFRYMPRRIPDTVTFPAAGVLLSNSDCGIDHCRIRLSQLKRDFSGGNYKCEISSEAPAFRLASATHHVTIAALPKEKPRIEGLAKSYVEGEMISARCVSSPTFPAPILSLYVTKRQSETTRLMSEMGYLAESDPEGLVSRTAFLKFPADRKFAQGDIFELECKMTLPGVPYEAQITKEFAYFKPVPPPQVLDINNQKLHWQTSSSTSASSSSSSNYYNTPITNYYLKLNILILINIIITYTNLMHR